MELSGISNLSNPTVIVAFSLVGIAGLLLALMFLSNEKAYSILVFFWACFVKPFVKKSSKNDHQSHLEEFYKSQAHIYDTTREALLKGRSTLLLLSVAHLQTKKGLVWIDIGGGTGSNIQKMNEILPITKHFKAIYLIDLSPSLCAVAKERCRSNGWKNVRIICGDACDFELGDITADLITFSYSLSMIPPYFAAIDHAETFLNKSTGVICSVDFGVQTTSTTTGRINTLGGLHNRHIPWVYRTFWRIWFEFDKVYLDPARRDYLEYRFGTLKSLNLYNKKLGNIPFYIWVGTNKSKESDALMHRFNSLATESPYLAPVDVETASFPISKALEACMENVKKGLPYPSLFYQKEVWRIYYDELSPHYDQFKSQYIYAFTWEDPKEDARFLNLTSNDTVLAITSAGDNVLSYAALPNAPQKIHAVDLNPCQGHLAELKLAALRSLPFEEVWKLFGTGKIDNFEDLLIKVLSPHLSSNAFQYWMEKGGKTFDIEGSGLYDTGSTRWALRLTRFIFSVTGLTDTVEELCQCKTVAEQRDIWDSRIRPILFSKLIGKFMIGNPVFLWKALGVPANQAAMMGDSTLKYVIDTLDPIIGRSLISKDNYFYYLCLRSQYRRDNCPDYLTKQGFNALSKRENSPLDNIRLHTDTLNDVFARLTNKALTVAVIMDHMDWFDPNGIEALNEIKALHAALSNGGRVLLRSASTNPWYIKKFEQCGFSCEAVATRLPGRSIDRVNMYASTWICKKIGASRKMSNLNI